MNLKYGLKNKIMESSRISTKQNTNQKSDHRSSQSVQFRDNRTKTSSISSIQNMANDSIQMKPNNTGLPNQLKSGIESLSGHSMDDVKVHYNSSKPAQLNAHAYAQGTDIHVASGQEKHVPHEAWHVVQQKQGRVQPTKQMKGKVNINDDAGLEKEADVMGEKALQAKFKTTSFFGRTINNKTIQRAMKTDAELDDRIDARGYYRWSSLRTGLVDDDDGHKKAEGFEAGVAGTDKNLKTLVKWGAPTQASGFEGVFMDAVRLGPDHKLGSPPASNGIWSVRRKDFSTLSGKRYIAGHLLNDNLGGPGNKAENLTAIPSSANSEHSDKIEEPIKDRVNKEGRWMHYSVNIDYGVLDNVNPADMGYTGSAAVKKANAKREGKYEDGTTPNRVKVRYANSLKAKWGPLDEDGNKTGSTEGKTIAITAPSHGNSTAAVALQGGDAHAEHYDEDIKIDGVNAQAVSEIGHEHLVLTNTSDIRAAHSARAPVVEHHQAYEDDAAEKIEQLTAENQILRGQMEMQKTLKEAAQNRSEEVRGMYFALARRVNLAGRGDLL